MGGFQTEGKRTRCSAIEAHTVAKQRFDGGRRRRRNPLRDRHVAQSVARRERVGKMQFRVARAMTAVSLDVGRAPVIIGGGLAGLMTASRLAPMPAVVLAKAPLGAKASSGWGQGGIAAAIGPDDASARPRAARERPPPGRL
jgi:hypothetical protein